MAKEIEIISLDLQIDKLEQSAVKSLRHLQDLQQGQKNLNKSSKELREKITTLSKAIASKEIVKGSEEWEKLQAELVKAQREYNNITDKMVKNKVALTDTQKEYRSQNKILDAFAEKHRKQASIIEQTDGSVKQLQQALGKNREIYRSLSKEERENAEIGGKLLSLINKQDDEYKKLSNQMGVTQVNVGNYKEEMKKAITTSFNLQSAATSLLGPFGSLAPILLAGAKGFVSFARGQNTATTSTSMMSKALKFFRIALISTGIGAIVVGLGMLIAAFLSTQRGVDAVTRVLNPLKSIMNSLWGVIQKLGSGMMDAFKNPKKALSDLYEFVKTNLINRFKAFGVILDGIINLDFKKISNGVLQAGTGVEDVIGKTKKLSKETGEFFNKAYNRGKEIAQLGIDIENAENRLIVKKSELNKIIKEQNKIAEDTTKTNAEREVATIKSIEASKQLVKEEQNILDLKIRQKKLQNEENDTDRKAQKELNELVAERNEKETQGLELQTTQTNKLNTIRQAAEAKRQKAIDNALKLQKLELDTYIANQGIKAKTLAEEVKLTETVTKKKKDILKAELKAKKISQEEYNLQIIQLDNDLAQKRANLTVDNASRELQAFKDSHQKKLDANTFFTAELLNQEIARLEAVKQKEQEYHTKRLEQGIINQTEYNDAIKQVDEEFRTGKQEAENTRKEAEKEQQAIDLENQRILDEENYATEYELKLARLEQDKQAEIETAEKKGADITLIEKKYANYKKKIDEQQQQTKVSLANQALSALSSVLDKESDAGKAVAVAQSIMNTAQGVTKALAEGGIMGIATGAIVAGVGAYNISKILNTKPPKRNGTPASLPKAEKGLSLTIGGNRHSQGGTKFWGEDGTHFEAERGEQMIVLNRKASALLPMFDSLNQLTGGNSLNYTGSYLASGGSVLRGNTSSTSKTAIDYDLLASKIGMNVAEANKNLPPQKVVVEEITQAQNDIAEVVNGASR